MTTTNRTWWKEGIVYQIYPKSFQDTSSNGLGDLKGISKRIDYIKTLGVDIVWLNPIYESPQLDNGYDISNYTKIHPDYGTMQDFDALLNLFHENGIKLIMDLVVNHTSNQHEWFKASASSRDNPYRDYYHWWPAEKGTPPKRWSFFDDESNAWQYDTKTNAYYLHYFAKEQPDLNWENPKLRQEIYQIMDFWFKKGIDGFRMDAISFLSKPIGYPEIPKHYQDNFVQFYAEGPDIHHYLQEMMAQFSNKYDIMTVGETTGATTKSALKFTSENPKELDMLFHFDHMELDRKPNAMFEKRTDQWCLTELKNIFIKWDYVFACQGWPAIFLGNHDFPRMVSRWGNDSADYHFRSATKLLTLLLTLRGTPFIYYGDEIGMTNIYFDDIDDYQDINTLKAYHRLKKQGEDPNEFIHNQKEISRDNARSPMQWNDSQNAGFSKGKPWIKVNNNHKNGVSVSQQEQNPNSILEHFKILTKLRKDNLTLVYGDFKVIQPKNKQVFAYTRSDNQHRFLILLNFSNQQVPFDTEHNAPQSATCIYSNTVSSAINQEGYITLKPYQANVFKL